MGKYKVDITGLKTSELKSLSNDEMIVLFNKYQQGDELARELLIAGNLKLVLSIILNTDLFRFG